MICNRPTRPTSKHFIISEIPRLVKVHTGRIENQAKKSLFQEPKLWYGIGILYDRYGSLEHAEEAFSQVMRMQPDFEKANEIYFRLGIIYKQQQKYAQSLEVSHSSENIECIS
jgi:tetratricopeptide (TPR) repeat protein